MVDGIVTGEVNDQRMIGRAPLGGEYLGHGRRVGGIGAQTVDRFGREGDEFAGAQQLDGAGVVGFRWDHSPTMPMAARAASAVSWTLAGSSPITVKWPILRPGRAWCLP